MSKKDYIVVKNVDKLLRYGFTGFLDKNVVAEVMTKTKGRKSRIYRTFPDAERLIIYEDNVPQITLFEIIAYEPLTHREIMGSLYNLNINSDFFGDIVICDERYYVFVLEEASNMLMRDFTTVGKQPIKLLEVPISTLCDFKRKYEELSFTVKNVRIDCIVAKIIGASRESVKKVFLNNDVQVNNQVCHKLEHKLSEDDTFSVRQYGKYKFGGVEKTNKKGNLVVKCYKYRDN